MDNPVQSIESLFEKIEIYSKTSYELLKMRVLETTSIVVALLLSKLVVVVTISTFMLFLNVGFALMLGDLLGRLHYGFFIVALFYLIMGIVFYFFFHKWTKKVLIDSIVTQALQ